MEFGDERVPARIWAKLVESDEGHWLWIGATGGRKTRKYGIAVLDGKLQGVHRWIYGVAVRPATKDEHVHHECYVSLCVNPAHLVAMAIAQHAGKDQRERTHCPVGHPYSEKNTYVRPDGHRDCRECNRTRCRERYWRLYRTSEREPKPRGARGRL